MFLNERSPLIAKVRTTNAELLILRKMEAIEIYSLYPNIWKRINKKSLHNMEQIYIKIKKVVIDLSNRYKIKIANYINKKNIKIKNKRKRNKINNLAKNVNNKIEEKENKDEKHETIVEFHENMNNQNIDMNLNEKNAMKDVEVENLTFIKKNTIQKETILTTDDKNKFLEGNSLIKNVSFKKNNLNIVDDDNFNKDKKICKTISNSKTENKNSKIHSSIYPNVCSSYKPQVNNDYKNSISNASSHLWSKLSKKTNTKKEKLLYNSFINLSVNREKTFQLNSSYDNINAISNNQYIKNINLQSKIKDILIKECININPTNNKTIFLKLPHSNINDVCRTPKSTKRVSFRNFQKLYGEKLDKNENSKSERSNSPKRKIKRTVSCKLIPEKKNIIHKTQSINKSTNKNLYDSTMKLFDMKKRRKLSSSINIQDYKNVKSLSPRKLKKKVIKNKSLRISIQLGKISKNIENTSKNIKNPEEFYMNMFNNIIAKQNKSFREEEDNHYNNILSQLSAEEVKRKDIKMKSFKDSNNKNINDLFILNKENNKETNFNIINHKIKQKSVFTSDNIS